MSSVIDEIGAKIRSLNAADRNELLRNLLADLDGPVEENVEQLWLEVAEARARELEEGKVEPVSGEQVFANVRSRLRR